MILKPLSLTWSFSRCISQAVSGTARSWSVFRTWLFAVFRYGIYSAGVSLQLFLQEFFWSYFFKMIAVRIYLFFYVFILHPFPLELLWSCRVVRLTFFLFFNMREVLVLHPNQNWFTWHSLFRMASMFPLILVGTRQWKKLYMSFFNSVLKTRKWNWEFGWWLLNLRPMQITHYVLLIFLLHCHLTGLEFFWCLASRILTQVLKQNVLLWNLL